jgi:hypothetical protein
VVEEPADNLARIDTVKSMLDNITDLKGIEVLLRQELGLSRQESTVIVGAVKNCLKQSESDAEISDEVALKLHNFLGDS